MQPNYTPEGVEAMRQFYRRNRTPREMPHDHHCNDCGADSACEVQPCYRPPNAPFSLCDACIEKNIAATLALIEEMES